VLRLSALLIATLAVALATGHSAAQNPPTERPCHELPFASPAAEAAQPAPGPASVGPPITMPVIVHFMKTTDPRHADRNDLRTTFTDVVITRLFAPGGPATGTVNGVWQGANIRLVLHRVEECDYDPVAFDIEAPDREEISSPMAGAFGEQLFSRINAAFNFTVVRGLDMYLWMDIRGGLVGYGASHRSTSPPRIGAIWIDKGCLTSLDAVRCTRLVAHEIGHFLGLCHSCETAMTRSGPCSICLPPGTATPPSCAGLPVNFIMRGTYDGTLLTDCEIAQARATALDRLNIP
jgi:hypothetical protein